MTKIKLVKTAKVECIKPHELKRGDYILWSNYKCKVVEIFADGSQERFALIEQFLDEPHSTIEIPKYSTFYKIIDVGIIEEEL